MIDLSCKIPGFVLVTWSLLPSRTRPSNHYLVDHIGRCEGLISVFCSQEEAKYEALEYLFEVFQSSSWAVKAYEP